MKPRNCPNEKCINHTINDMTQFYKRGKYKNKKKHDVQMYCCKKCGKRFNTKGQNKYQKKPELLKKVWSLMSRGMSQRDIAIALNCNRRTVESKIIKLADLIKEHHFNRLKKVKYKIIYFDEMIVNMRYKDNPMVIGTLCSGGRFLDFYIADTPKTGGMKKEGAIQKEINIFAMKELEHILKRAKQYLVDDFTIITDEHPHYQKVIEKTFKGLSYRHKQYNSEETRKMKDDQNPLRIVNILHSSMRHRIARIRRKTICVTRNIYLLENAIIIYLAMFNRYKIFPYQKTEVPRIVNNVLCCRF